MIALAGALWIAAAVRYIRWSRHPRVEPALGTIIVLAALAALTTSNTRVLSTLGLNTAVISCAQQLLLVTACVGAEVVVAGLAQPARLGRVFRRLALGAAVLGLSVIVLFALGPAIPAGLSVYEFAARYAGNRYYGGAFLIVQIYAGLACGRVAYFAIPLTRNVAMRVPMILLVSGSVILALYAIFRSSALIAALTIDIEPHLTALFKVMSVLGALGAALLIASFCWVPVRRTGHSIRLLLRQGPIYCQVTHVDPQLAANWRVGGLSLSRRADVRATAVLDFLTLLLPQPVSEARVDPDAVAVAQWLSIPTSAPARPELQPGMLAVPVGQRPAEWLDEVLRALPECRSRLLQDLDQDGGVKAATTRTSSARLITELSAPWLVNTLAALYVGAAADALAWGALAAFVAGVGPILAILALMKLGRADDHHVRDRRHRGLVVSIIVGFMALGIWAEVFWGAPRSVIALSCAGFITIVAVGAVTTVGKYKISVHMAVWAGTTVLLAALVDPPWLLASAALPLIGWARVQLRDHTVGQVLSGAVLGISTVILTLLVLPH